jgi:hypothetical protein
MGCECRRLGLPAQRSLCGNHAKNNAKSLEDYDQFSRREPRFDMDVEKTSSTAMQPARTRANDLETPSDAMISTDGLLSGRRRAIVELWHRSTGSDAGRPLSHSRADVLPALVSQDRAG